MLKQVANEMRDQMMNQVLGELEVAVTEQVGGRVRDQMINRMWEMRDQNQINHQVIGGVWIEVWREVMDKVVGQVTTQMLSEVLNQVRSVVA